MKNNKNKKRLVAILDWIISMLVYSIILLIASLIFDETLVVDTSSVIPGLWYLIATLIIYLLNKTIKPILVWLTLPITGITMGLSYPFINVVILYLTDLILGSHFELHGIWMTFVLAIFISLFNIVLQKFIIDPLIKKEG